MGKRVGDENGILASSAHHFARSALAWKKAKEDDWQPRYKDTRQRAIWRIPGFFNYRLRLFDMNSDNAPDALCLNVTGCTWRPSSARARSGGRCCAGITYKSQVSLADWPPFALYQNAQTRVTPVIRTLYLNVGRLKSKNSASGFCCGADNLPLILLMYSAVQKDPVISSTFATAVSVCEYFHRHYTPSHIIRIYKAVTLL